MTNSYFISVLLHLGLFLFAFMVTPPLLENLDKQITVEIIEPVAAPATPVSQMPQALPAQASADEKVEVAKEIKAAVRAPIKPAKVVKAQPKKSVAKAAQPKAVRAGSPVPETLDDIEASDLDYDAVAMTQAGALNESDLDSEFSQIDQKSEAALKTQQSDFDRELKNLTEDSEQQLASIEEENQAQAKAMADSLKATRTKNAMVLAQMRAGEAAAEQARLAREGAARAAAAKAGSAQGGKGQNAFGSATGPVRSIENLRQMAGNPKPQYSMDERFRKEQGTVVFQAFVTQQGSLENFRLVQSTGYRNLDGKTLAALKKWKFYPGQQGWVEIPQTWNLKGEAEEMPTTLRRKISKN